MKIVFAYQFLTKGGVEVVLRNRIIALDRLGIDARAIFLRESDGGHELFEDLPGRTAVLTQATDVEAYLRELQPDWVTSIDSPSIMPIVRRTLPDAGLVYEVHTAYPYYQRQIMDPHTLEGVRGVIVPSDSQAELVAQRIAYPLPIKVVPNPLPEIFFSIADPWSIPEYPVLAWVGRLDSLKNWRAFVEIAQRLNRHGRFQYWMIGAEGEPGQRDELMARVQSAGISDRFRAFHQIDHREMPSAYRTVALSGGCIVSTSWGESFGLALLEAMASGCPVVAPDVVGIKDLVRHEETGWTYPPMNVDRACELILTRVRDSDSRAKVSSSGQAFARRFTASASIQALLSALDKWSNADPALARQNKLIHYRESISHDSALIKELRQRVGSLRLDLEQLDANDGALREDVLQAHREIDDQKRELADRETTIETLRQRLLVSDRKLQEFLVEGEAQKRALAELQSAHELLKARERSARSRFTEGAKALRELRTLHLSAENTISELKGRVAQKESLLAEIQASRAWRLMKGAWKIRLWLAPHGTKREAFLLFGLHAIGALRSGTWGPALRSWAASVLSLLRNRIRWTGRRFIAMAGKLLALILPAKWYGLLASMRMIRYRPVDNSRVILYAESEELFPEYRPRNKLSGPRRRRISASLVMTTKNGGALIDMWFKQLLAQTRRPDEVVVVDAGSIDSTLELLREYQASYPGWINVIVEPGANYARGRNLGTKAARNPYVVMTDLGVDLDPNWVDRILVPFEKNPETQVVAGWYKSQSNSRFGRASKGALVPSADLISPGSFLPSARSIAYTVEAWETVGGFPEWLTRTGEDTYFALELKKRCPNWAFVPEATVIWHAPERFGQFWGKAASWAFGDGEAALSANWHWNNLVSTSGVLLSILTVLIVCGLLILLQLPAIAALMAVAMVGLAVGRAIWVGLGKRALAESFWTAVCRLPRLLGYVRGAANRPAVRARRFSGVEGVFLILAGVPIDDTGGGTRGTQITLELIERGYLVIYINRFPKYESKDLGLRYEHPNLQLYQLSEFDWRAFSWTYSALIEQKPLGAIVEFPLDEFLPIIGGLRRSGGRVIYDLLDDWQTSLGGEWYSKRTEQQIIEASDVLVATAESLVERLEEMSNRDAKLISNAVNLRIFNRRADLPRPDEIDARGLHVVYVGALWGDWFDWNLLRAIGESLPEARILVIGDYRGQCADPPDNLFFLGLKAQTRLPAYLAHSDVAIIPWKVSPITHATSPLKVYEYLAMGLPVVAPKLSALEGIPYVFAAETQEEFIRNIRNASMTDIDPQILDAFLAANSWQSRVDKLVEVFKQPATGESE